MDVRENTAKYLFYTGKGGVGKTTLACGAAIHLAEAGQRTLLVSTDPASNLDQVLEAELGSEPRAVPGVPNLDALNIDPDKAVEAYRRRAVEPYKDILPGAELRKLEEQMAGACTVEIAAFDEFTQILAGTASWAAQYDRVVFDTAPTGHTLRLLQLPAAWSSFIETNESGASCLGPVASLKSKQAMYAAAVEALTDAERTVLYLVSRPERGALAEAARTSGELRELGVENQRLLLNAVFRPADESDRVASSIAREQQAAIAAMPEELRGLERAEFPMRVRKLVGVEALRTALDTDSAAADLGAEAPDVPATTSLPPPLGEYVDGLLARGRGLVMFMGKGGVGKTTLAAAVATELAARGAKVHLTTTDPAAHLSQTLEGELEGLTVTRIDPAAERDRYVRETLDRARQKVSEQRLALMEEDLRSPCTEEVAVFKAFARAVSAARDQFVVVDTAPTGHTLLLLDTTGAYHKEIARNLPEGAGKVTTPMMRLQDPDYTHILLLTLPEATPVTEAGQLQDDLRRAGIEPHGWVLNNCLSPAGTTDPVLARRALLEREHISSVAEKHAVRTFLAPWQTESPVGVERLRDVLRGPAQPAGAMSRADHRIDAVPATEAPPENRPQPDRKTGHK